MDQGARPQRLLGCSFLQQRRFSSLVARLGHWVPFAILLLWGWRGWNIFATVPGYGDVLEVPWSVWWIERTLLNGQGDWLFNPSIFFPEGWHVATFAQRPAAALLLLPFARLGGLAFAFNAVSLLSFAVAFSGMRRLSLRFLTPFAATLAGLLFTFWSFRWGRIGGHMHMLLGTALLPWIVWAAECGFYSEGRRGWWCVTAGLLWALAMSFALYMVWIGGFVLGGWVTIRWMSRETSWRQAVGSLLVPSLIAVTLNAPFFYFLLRADHTLSYCKQSALWGSAVQHP